MQQEQMKLYKQAGVSPLGGCLPQLIQLPILCLMFMLNIIRYAGKADIIHAQWTLSALLALPARWLRRARLVVTARGSDIRLLPAWLNRFIFRRVDAAIDWFKDNGKKAAWGGSFSKLRQALSHRFQ